MRIPRIVPVLLLPLFFAAAASAQVNLKLRTAHGTVVEMEPVIASLTIANEIGSPLTLGGSNATAELFFDVESSAGVLVKRLAPPLFEQPAEVGTRGSASFDFDLTQLYEIRQRCPYTVTARLKWNGEFFVSDKVFLEVVPGMEVGRLNLITAEKPPVRFSYLLKTLTRERRDVLLFRMDDETRGICYGVYDLGSIVRVFKPVMKVDGQGCVHVLHQSAPTRFTHSVFDAQGGPVSTKFYTGRSTETTLKVNEDGDVSIGGAQPYVGDSSAAPHRTDSMRMKPGQP